MSSTADRIVQELIRYDESIEAVTGAGLDMVIPTASRMRAMSSNGYGAGLISSEAAEVYRLQWCLSEISDFAQLLASAREPGPDTDVAVRELRKYLVL